MKTEKIYVYQEIKSLNTWIKAIVWIYVACQILFLPTIFLFSNEINNINQAISQDNTEMGDLALPNTMLMGAMLLLTGAVLIVSAILIGVWINRSHKNARALNIQGIEQSPAWAVGSFFVPIINWFVPYRAMKSLVSGSLNAANFPQINVGYWWAAWLIGNFTSRLSDTWSKQIERTMPENPSFEQYLTYFTDLQQTFYLDASSGILLMISAILLLKIMQNVNAAHQKIAQNHIQAA